MVWSANYNHLALSIVLVIKSGLHGDWRTKLSAESFRKWVSESRDRDSGEWQVAKFTCSSTTTTGGGGIITHQCLSYLSRARYIQAMARASTWRQLGWQASSHSPNIFLAWNRKEIAGCWSKNFKLFSAIICDVWENREHFFCFHQKQ